MEGLVLCGIAVLVVGVQLFRGKWLGLMAIGGRWSDQDEDKIRKDASKGYGLFAVFIGLLLISFAVLPQLA